MTGHKRVFSLVLLVALVSLVRAQECVGNFTEIDVFDDDDSVQDICCTPATSGCFVSFSGNVARQETTVSGVVEDENGAHFSLQLTQVDFSWESEPFDITDNTFFSVIITIQRLGGSVDEIIKRFQVTSECEHPSTTSTSSPSKSNKPSVTSFPSESVTPTTGPSESPTPSVSSEPSESVTPTTGPSESPTPSVSSEPSESVTPTTGPSESSTPSVSSEPSKTPSVTKSLTNSPSVSETSSESVSLTLTSTSSLSVSKTSSGSVSLTPTSTSSLSASRTSSGTVSLTPTSTNSLSVSETPSESVSLTTTPTSSSSVSSTTTPTNSLSASKTSSESASLTSTPTSAPSASSTSTPSPTKTPSESSAPTASQSVSPSRSPHASCVCENINSFWMRFNGMGGEQQGDYYNVNLFGDVQPVYLPELQVGDHVRVWGSEFTFEMTASRDGSVTTLGPFWMTCDEQLQGDFAGGIFTAIESDIKWQDGSRCAEHCEYDLHVVVDLSLEGGLSTTSLNTIKDDLFYGHTRYFHNKEKDHPNVSIHAVYGESVITVNGDPILLDGSLGSVRALEIILNDLHKNVFPNEGPSGVPASWLNVFESFEGHGPEETVLFFVSTQPNDLTDLTNYVQDNKNVLPVVVPISMVEPFSSGESGEVTVAGLQTISSYYFSYPKLQRTYFIMFDRDCELHQHLHQHLCCFDNKDECGVCYGDNSTCVDCNGVNNGHSVHDKCGVCGGDGSTCPPENCQNGNSSIAVVQESCLSVEVVDVDKVLFTLESDFECKEDCVLVISFTEPNQCGITQGRGPLDKPYFGESPLFSSNLEYCDYLWPSQQNANLSQDVWVLDSVTGNYLANFTVAQLSSVATNINHNSFFLEGELWVGTFRRPISGFCDDSTVHDPMTDDFSPCFEPQHTIDLTKARFKIIVKASGDLGASVIVDKTQRVFDVQEKSTVWTADGNVRITFTTESKSGDYYLSDPVALLDQHEGVTFHPIDHHRHSGNGTQIIHHPDAEERPQKWTIGTYDAAGVSDFSGIKVIQFDIISVVTNQVLGKHLIYLDVTLIKKDSQVEAQVNYKPQFGIYKDPRCRIKADVTEDCQQVYGKVSLQHTHDTQNVTLTYVELCTSDPSSPVALIEFDAEDPFNTGCKTNGAIVNKYTLYEETTGYINDYFDFEFTDDEQGHSNPGTVLFTFHTRAISNSTQIIQVGWSILDPFSGVINNDRHNNHQVLHHVERLQYEKERYPDDVVARFNDIINDDDDDDDNGGIRRLRKRYHSVQNSFSVSCPIGQIYKKGGCGSYNDDDDDDNHHHHHHHHHRNQHGLDESTFSVMGFIFFVFVCAIVIVFFGGLCHFVNNSCTEHMDDVYNNSKKTDYRPQPVYKKPHCDDNDIEPPTIMQVEVSREFARPLNQKDKCSPPSKRRTVIHKNVMVYDSEKHCNSLTTAPELNFE